MEQQYATALWRLIENGMDPKKAVEALHEQLARSGRTALMPRIGKAFARLAEREMRKGGVVLEVAREEDGKSAMREAKPMFSDMGVKAEEVQVRVDESLVGGWRLEGKEHLVDASFKKMLLDMYNRATAA